MARVFLVVAVMCVVPWTAAAEARRPAGGQGNDAYAQLRSQNVDEVVAAIAEVQRQGGPRATSALIDLLRSGTPDRVTSTALEALGATSEARYYPGGLHAFHAFVLGRVQVGGPDPPDVRGVQRRLGLPIAFFPVRSL